MEEFMSTKHDDAVQQWLQTIPREVWSEVRHHRVLEAGFGAGPSFIGGKTEIFAEPVSIEDGLRWLSRYAGCLRIAHLQLEDLSILFLEPLGFKRWDQTRRAPPRAGVVVRHPAPEDSEVDSTIRRSD